MEYRLRPKSNFVNEANWQSLHSLSLHWQSDMIFYLGELRFLRKLVDKYFIWLLEDDSLEATLAQLKRMSKSENQAADIVTYIKKHIKHIEKELKHPLVQNDKPFRDEHSELEDLIAAFVRDFRLLKQKVFDLTDDVLVEEKVKNLMAHY
jgi:hypothetical protein